MHLYFIIIDKTISVLLRVDAFMLYNLYCQNINLFI